MAYTTINKSSSFMNTKLYTGNDGTGRSITGVGFQPDFVWVKDRSNAFDHGLFDAVRGATKALNSNDTSAEDTISNSLTAFGSDGFTAGANAIINGNNNNYASWNWKANGTGSSNTDGSITSTVSVNTTSGFSIVKYTGTGVIGTVGHGLGAVPKMFMIKDLTSSNDWQVYTNATGNNQKMHLNLTSAAASSGNFNSTTPTSSVFSISGGGQVNTNYSNYITYCFSDVQGFSKFGNYTGNANADGPFIYTGFKPAFVILKNSTGGGQWIIIDNKRQGETVGGNARSGALSTSAIEASSTAIEAGASSGLVDILSNGFKILQTNADFNASGATYIYMAFGQTLVGTNNVPANAR